MLFSYNKNIHLPLIKIGNHKIHEAETMKFLGIYFDNKFKFNKHISHITTKLSKSILILYKIHKFLPRNTLNLLYQSFVRLYLAYGIEALHSVNETLNNKAFLLQKKAIREIRKVRYRDHTNENVRFLNILKLNELHKYQTSIYLYKTLFNNYDQKLNNQLTSQSNVHTQYTT